ncbi:MAG: Mor transcription activator family protein [Shewanella sp.]
MANSTPAKHAANEENGDLFGFDNVTLEDVERLIEDEESLRWPVVMSQIYQVLKQDLERHNVDTKIAITLLNSICKEFGGVQFYLPRGCHLEAEIMNLSIWHEFKGNNVEELARKYEKSMNHIWRVIKKMRSREVKNRQQGLF